MNTYTFLVKSASWRS